MMRAFLVILWALFLVGCSNLKDKKAKIDTSGEPIVIMVGIDGLRWDAIDRHPAPALSALAKEGVRADRMIPVMPSLTFVNFYSLATGLYADRTGITGNLLYSREQDDVMLRGSHGETRWWGGEPIWVTAEKQDVRTAAMFWLGSEAEIKGKRPTHWSPYEHNKPNEERVDQVLEWLAMPEEERPRLITLYFHVVDSAGHRYGPETVEEGNTIREVDNRLADLRAGIAELGLEDRVNILVVSDHGMVLIEPDNLVYLDDYIDLENVFIPQFHSEDGPRSGPFVHVFVKDGDVDGVYQKLVNANENMKVFKREDIPQNWHLNNTDRTGDIFISASSGWMIFARSLTSVYRYPAIGMHGYDRFDEDMGATFIAAGPNIRQGADVGTIENVEVYGIIARILGLEPADTDGNIENVEHFLKP